VVVMQVHGSSFFDCTGSEDELVLHGLRALRDTLPNEVELTTKARSFAFCLLQYCTCSVIQDQTKMLMCVW